MVGASDVGKVRAASTEVGPSVKVASDGADDGEFREAVLSDCQLPSTRTHQRLGHTHQGLDVEHRPSCRTSANRELDGQRLVPVGGELVLSKQVAAPGEPAVDCTGTAVGDANAALGEVALRRRDGALSWRGSGLRRGRGARAGGAGVAHAGAVRGETAGHALGVRERHSGGVGQGMGLELFRVRTAGEELGDGAGRGGRLHGGGTREDGPEGDGDEEEGAGEGGEHGESVGRLWAGKDCGAG